MANEIRLRRNNISGTTTDNPLLIGATTINSPGFVDLPTVDTTNHLLLILDPLEVNGAAEIVQVTAHTAASSVVTVIRGFDTTTPRQHGLGTTWFHGPVASDYVPSLPADVSSQWVAFSPTVTQSGVATKTDVYTRYIKMGRLVTWSFFLTITGGAAVGANPVTLTLPFTAAAGVGSLATDIGVGSIFNTSAGTVHKGLATTQGAGATIAFRLTSDTTTSVLGSVGFTEALAAGDQIQGTVTYEATS